MADEATLKIEIEDDPRANALLDEAFKGGASPPPLPKGGPQGAASATPVGGPNFPATVMGPDGKQYSADAYLAAQRKFQSQQKAAEAGSAYDTFFGPPPLPKGGPKPPDTVNLDGKRYDWDAVQAAKQKKAGEEKREAAGEAYKSLYGGKEAEGGALQKLLGQLGGGGLGKALGGIGGLTGEAGAAGVAGGAGAALGVAAAAAPYVALVAVGAKVLTDSFNRVAKAANQIGDDAAGLVMNQMPDLRAKVDDAADALGDTIPILGGVAAAGIKAANAIASIPEKLDAAFIARAKQLEGLNANIAGAEARADVRALRADIREANELGQGMGRLVDAQSRIDTTIRDLLLPIKKFVLEVLAVRLEIIADVLGIIANFPTIIQTVGADVGSAIVLALDLEFTKARETIEKIPEDIRKILEKPDEKDLDMLNEFFGDAHRAAAGLRPAI